MSQKTLLTPTIYIQSFCDKGEIYTTQPVSCGLISNINILVSIIAKQRKATRGFMVMTSALAFLEIGLRVQ